MIIEESNSPVLLAGPVPPRLSEYLSPVALILLFDRLSPVFGMKWRLLNSNKKTNVKITNILNNSRNVKSIPTICVRFCLQCVPFRSYDFDIYVEYLDKATTSYLPLQRLACLYLIIIPNLW